VYERDAIRRDAGARQTGRRRPRALAIVGFLIAALAAPAQPVASSSDFAPCMHEPTIACLIDEYRRLVAPVLERGESIGWENIQRLIVLGELDLALEAVQAISIPDVPQRSERPSVRELDRRNNLQITRALALVAVMNAELEGADFSAAREILALTSGMGRIRGVIEYHAARIAAGLSGLDAYSAARANLGVVLRESFRDVSAGRWFDGAGYSKIGEHLSIPAATAMAQIGDVDHALAVAIAQNRGQATGLPNAIGSMVRQLLAVGDTATVRGLAEHMRRLPERFIELDHWTTVLAELAASETRRGDLDEARKLYARVVEGYAAHRPSPNRDQLLLALLTEEFVRTAPDGASNLVYESEVLDSATRGKAESRFAAALKTNGEDTRLLAALRDNGLTYIATRESSEVRESIAVALTRRNRIGEALDLLRAGSSVSARREVIELLIRRDALDDARAVLEPVDLPGFATRLLELGRKEDARAVLDDCWSTNESSRPLEAELVFTTLETIGHSATEELIEMIADRTRQEQAWVQLGNALVDRGEIAAAQAAYEKGNLTEEQEARVQQYFDAVRGGRPAAAARFFATEAIRDDAGMFLPSDTQVYPPRIPGLKPLAFFRAITRIEYWVGLPDDEKRELLLRAAVGLMKESN